MAELPGRLQTSVGTAFTVERELAGGGMARVFLARDHALDRHVVLKVLDLESSAAASGERFRREIRLIAKLQHPHIVPVLTAGGDDTLLWYVMPFVAGESLRARLVREGALSVADALAVMRELLDALGFAHERGIIHRDVKPENILLEGSHAVVADFGVAKALADAGVGSGLTSGGMAIGTPAYMAPEQAMADPTTNHRADLYASGAVLYEMLVGAPPFSGNPQAVVAAHLTAPAPRVHDRRRDVPQAVANLVERLLAKNPAERPQTAREVLGVLGQVSTPEGPLASASLPASATSRLQSRGRRRRIGVRSVLLAGLVLALAAGAAGAWWWQRTHTATVASGADVIAVIPLGSTGDSALARLGRELVVTLSANLDGVGTLRAVDAMSVILRADKRSRPLSFEEARAVARELGARSVLHGSLVRDGGLVRADARLYAVDGDRELARVVARASVDSVGALTDSLTNDILRQVWRRGNAPSPVLSEVTTRSNEALRAFLSGEANFQRFAWEAALADYARAAELDTMFAQVYLRLEYVRTGLVLPTDPVVHRRLLALTNRLPLRDRELLAVRFANISPRMRIDSGRALAARYPDYPVAQYEVADDIIHYGPAHGVAIGDAIPFLDRLDALAPTHGDNALHRLWVAVALGDTAMQIAAAKRLETISSSAATYGGFHARVVDALQRSSQLPPEEAAAIVRNLPRLARMSPAMVWIPPLFYAPLTRPGVSDSLLRALQRQNVFAGMEPAVTAARGYLAITRGDFAEGIAALASIETSTAPMIVRLGAARSAAIGSWMGAVSPASADAALARARGSLGALGSTEAAEVAWLDGLVAIAARDSARVGRAAAAITDTAPPARHLRRSIHALWRAQQTGKADSVRALEDAAIEDGTTFLSSMPLHRWAIARELVRDGEAARAEHYLQWSDAIFPTEHGAVIVSAFAPYNAYERGVALEAAGDRARALRYFGTFIDAVDKPSPAIRPMVDDALARFAKLSGDTRR